MGEIEFLVLVYQHIGVAVITQKVYPRVELRFTLLLAKVYHNTAVTLFGDRQAGLT